MPLSGRNSTYPYRADFPSQLSIQEWLMAKCRTNTYGQNVAAMEAGIFGGGGDAFLNEWSRQNSARNKCEINALGPKRSAAEFEWGPDLASPEQAESLRAWGRIFQQMDQQAGHN
jgi:hypothetical protein